LVEAKLLVDERGDNGEIDISNIVTIKLLD
jgi:hypothetical protein